MDGHGRLENNWSSVCGCSAMVFVYIDMVKAVFNAYLSSFSYPSVSKIKLKACTVCCHSNTCPMPVPLTLKRDVIASVVCFSFSKGYLPVPLPAVEPWCCEKFVLIQGHTSEKFKLFVLYIKAAVFWCAEALECGLAKIRLCLAVEYRTAFFFPVCIYASACEGFVPWQVGGRKN